MNPLMGNAPNMGGVNPQAVQSVKRMMNMLRFAQNPQQAMMQAAQQNPALNTVMQMVNGRNPQQVFYEECQRRGINPDDILNQLK